MLDKFKAFLSGAPNWMNEDSRESWTHFLISSFPVEMREWHDSNLVDVWSKDNNYYEAARRRLSANAVFRKECAAADMILQACKLLVQFFEDEKRKAQLGKTTKKKTSTTPDIAVGGDAQTIPSAVEVLEEGAIVEMHIAKHERNVALRRACIEHYRTQHGGQVCCEACGMSLGDVYGDIGEGYIEVHHLNPISQTEGSHKVDPTTDLVPLCANCHAMIHRLMSAEKKVSGTNLEGVAALSKLQAIIQERTAHA